ncbi:MAG: DUF4097 domain-containing protein [Clostridiales bacterium]|nr:DUF4097 domain-containing protein [Clostridiales bacterium]
MNKQIRSLIDEIFSEMKMTAENLALRDELMANAQAHFEDEIEKGKSEEEALRIVAESLEDVRALLFRMNEAPKAETPKPKEKPAPFWSAMEPEKPKPEPEAAKLADDKKEAADSAASGTADALSRAFDAIGDFGRQILPQTKRMIRKADEATGGMLGDFGRAVEKGVRDVSKVAGDTIDRMTGGKTEEPEKAPEMSPEELRKKAGDIRAEAELKQVVGDQEGAREMRRRAYLMETRADAIEQEAALAAAREEAKVAEAAEKAARAEEEPDAAAEAMPLEESDGEEAEAREENGPEAEEPGYEGNPDWLRADGEIDKDKFAAAVDDLKDQADAAAKRTHDAAFRAEGGATVLTRRLPAVGLQKIEIRLDDDDVEIASVSGNEVEVIWHSGGEGGEAPHCSVDGHCLTVRRENPDLFRSFFSVFQKAGGRVSIRVPKGYGLTYEIRTVSGDIRVAEVDADDIEVNTTSGSVRLEPDATKRAERFGVSTVSGDIAVSACARDVAVKSVTGSLFVSCDASRVDADTVSGKTHIEGACDTWEVNAVSGPVELLCTAVPTDKISIATVSAQAKVALPSSIRGFAAEVSGPQKTIVNEFGPDRYGTCALPIRLETLSGKLILTRL